METLLISKTMRSMLTVQDYQFLNDLKDTVRLFLFSVCQTKNMSLKKYRADLETVYHALNALIVTTFSRNSYVFVYELYVIYQTLERMNLSFTVQDYHSKEDFIFDLKTSTDRLYQIIKQLSEPL